MEIKNSKFEIIFLQFDFAGDLFLMIAFFQSFVFYHTLCIFLAKFVSGGVSAVVFALSPARKAPVLNTIHFQFHLFSHFKTAMSSINTKSVLELEQEVEDLEAEFILESLRQREAEAKAFYDDSKRVLVEGEDDRGEGTIEGYFSDDDRNDSVFADQSDRKRTRAGSKSLDVLKVEEEGGSVEEDEGPLAPPGEAGARAGKKAIDPNANAKVDMDLPFFELAKLFVQKKEIKTTDHTLMEYYPFKKNLYVQVKEISLMSEEDVSNFRKANGDIVVKGQKCPRPVRNFAQCGLSSKILTLLHRKGEKSTLETSGEDQKIHSKRVEKIRKYTRNEWRRYENTLETSGEDQKIFF